MFCDPGHVFGSTEAVGSRYHVCALGLRASGHVFMFCALGLVSGGTEGVESRLHVLRSQISFQRCRVRLVSFSCFAQPDSILTVPRTFYPVGMFFAPGHVFGGAEGVESRFHVLRSRTRFRDPFSGNIFMICATGLIFGGTKGVGSRFLVLRSQTSFSRYGGCRVPFSCFPRPNSFSTVSRASSPVFMFALQGTFSAIRRASAFDFMFYAPGLIFGGTEGVGTHFHILRARTNFRRYRGRRVPFSCFALPD
jgi:hypothetical protein